MNVEMWLAAFSDGASADEVRRHWNVDEAPALDALIDAAPKFRLGRTRVPEPGNEDSRGPVGRVFDLLWLRGTVPSYTMPLLTPTLENELLQAFLPRPGDPRLDVADVEAFAFFLKTHRGHALATTEKVVE
jgi:hypothetical protein